MSILGIQNRTENWKTALYFSPMFRDCNLRLALAKMLGEPDGTQPAEVHLELYWKGMRDYLHKTKQKRKDNIQDFKKRYMCLFPNLRKKIKDFGKFKELQDLNYDVLTEPRKDKLSNNLFNTEIDIVLETPNHLFIGEAKHEMGFGANGDLVLVHQLIRQYVMAKTLINRLASEGCVSKKKVVPFVVRNNPKGREQAQVDFMVCQGWLKKKNVLTWECIENLTRNS